MNLCLYSSGLHSQDIVIDEAVFHLLSEQRNPKLSLLLASPDAYNFVVPAFSRYLQEFCTATRAILIPEESTTDRLKEEIESSDLLFLSGGNTYHFLHNIRNYNLSDIIKNYAKGNHVVAGSSAGSIIMTPTIKTAEIPTDEADDNYDNVTDLTGLGLVKFEVTPHYQNNAKADAELRNYSQTSGKIVYALPDGAGILITATSEKFFGTVTLFADGEQNKVSCCA